MNERASPAYWSSVILHALVVVVIILLAYVSSQSTPNTSQVMELVAGPGDNYMGTEATKLGTENGIELKVPATPAPATPAPPVPEESAPIVPVEPAPPAPTKPAKAKLPANPMMKAVVVAEIRAESKIKMHDAKVKKAQEKAAAEARKKESYNEFMKSQGTASAPKGRTAGVEKGTTLADGGGGKALTAQQIDAIEAWKSMLKKKWIDGFVPPPDFDQKMVATVSFHVSASGTISGIHVSGSTGGPAFAAAVEEALRHVTMPAYPTKRGEDYVVPFSLKDDG